MIRADRKLVLCETGSKRHILQALQIDPVDSMVHIEIEDSVRSAVCEDGEIVLQLLKRFRGWNKKFLLQGILVHRIVIVGDSRAALMGSAVHSSVDDKIDSAVLIHRKDLDAMFRHVVTDIIGCRAAEGGEFTRRAFMNGRLDLSQAEAVADVIASASKSAHRIAVSQMRGGFSRMLSSLRERLLEFVSLMELELDFSEEDVEFADRTRLIAIAEEINTAVTRLADSFAVGNAIKNGFPVAIVGEPNAGKSTLLNRLLHDDKALVSDIRGTTRDVIEDTITLGGLTFRFIDTAGIRQTTDTIETMGIERTFKKLDEAAIILWMIDGTQPVANIATVAADILPHAEGKHLVAVINKIDCLSDADISALRSAVATAAPSAAIATISAKADIAVDSLEQSLIEAAAVADTDPNAVIVTNARHYDALLHAGEAIRRALDGLRSGISGDFVSQDIRECMHYLGEITGEITTYEILGSIFSRFCIGK